MSADLRFQGHFTFPDEAARTAAEADLQELLDGEDPELIAILDADEALRFEGATAHVQVALSGPSDWFFALEAVVETLAQHASAGQVDAWLDEEPMDPYLPGEG